MSRAPCAPVLPLLLALACCGGGLAGCGGEPGEVLPQGDFAIFIEDVQPILEARCANPSCHGSPLRPLELYAPERHRLNPDDVFLKTPLSHDELHANYLRASAFIDDFNGTSSLLRKPIDVVDGGMVHEGGVCFESTDDVDWQVMRAWVRQALAKQESP